MKPSARAAWLAVIVVTTLGWFAWTAMSSFAEPPRLRPLGYPETDHFNLLSHGFRNGHLYLDAEVPAALKTLANPYDPAQRRDIVVLHDASYFRGHYYIYFGPAPVVTLLLPFSIVTGRDLPLAWAVWVFASGGLLALAGTLLFLQRRHYRQASLVTTIAAIIALAGGGMALALLRRPNVWELSAACGFCFLALGVLCLVRGLHSPRATIWALFAGLALGLAAASRASYLVSAAMFVALLARRSADAGTSRTARRFAPLIGAMVGCGAMVAALLAYNFARFGDAFEFGQKYQLSAINEGAARHFGLDFVWFNFRVYFLSVLRWLPTFPFHHGIAVPPLPAGQGGYEYAFGLWPNLPSALFAFAAGLAWKRSHGNSAASPLRASLTGLAIAGAAQVVVLLGYFGACVRYMVDFAPVVMMLAALGIWEIETRLTARGLRVAWQAVTLVLAIFTSFAAAMSVARIYTPPGQLPVAYQPIARALNYPYFWLQQRHAPTAHPVEIQFSLPSSRTRRTDNLVTLARGQRRVAAVTLDYLDGTQVKLTYTERSVETMTAPSVILSIPPNTPQVLRLRLGGRYSEFDGQNWRLRAQLNGQPLWDAPAVSLAAFPAKMRLISAAEFFGRLHSAQAIGESSFATPSLGGARVRLQLAATMRGRAFPLATAGRSGAGDLLFMRVTADALVFGYDHWGDALLLSPPVPLDFAAPHVVEFWIPAVGGKILVKVDGREVWQQAAPSYTATAETYFVATNPIGGTTCEPVLPNAVIETQQLPVPP